MQTRIADPKKCLQMYQKHGGTNVSVEDLVVSFRKPHEAWMPQKVSPVCFMVFCKLPRPVSEGGKEDLRHDS
jgi:hypothetical protein